MSPSPRGEAAPAESTSSGPVIAISPHGRLFLLPTAADSLSESLRAAFSDGSGPGLLELSLAKAEADLSADFAFWRDFGRLYLTRLCSLADLAEMEAKAQIELPPPREELAAFAGSAPPMVGAEYITGETCERLWEELHQAFLAIIKKSPSIQEFFESRGSQWNVVGRVCFHLAENKGDESSPFAFLATYSPKLSNQGKAQHVPLGRALQEYAGEKNKAKLLRLLLPVQKASSQSGFLKEIVDSGEVFHPLAWGPVEAFRFLKDVPAFESAGVIVRVPDWWKPKSPPRPQVFVTIGGKKGSALGLDSLLSFSVKLTLGGEELSEKEIRQILSQTNGLALIRGRWVEIDREKLREVLDHWKRVECSAGEEGLSFIEGMRLLAGVVEQNTTHEGIASVAEWSTVVAGEVLAKQLEELRDPGGELKADVDPGAELKATLRPYQRVGVQWLWFLNRLGLGGCLADDMGLGKTIQVISLLLLLKRLKRDQRGPSLLVVPASLLGNWNSELDRFAPSIRYVIAHPSHPQALSKEAPTQEALSRLDLVITTYGYLSRLPWIPETQWDCLVIDEAQAIKNAGSKQTRAVKALKSRHRVALTGTPVENSLGDLWSLYDFLCPGLLGSAKEFDRFVKGAQKEESPHRFAALRSLVKPYLLRRLKTDKKIIADLPEKTEVSAYCALTKTQAALYQESVTELSDRIEKVEGIQRRGLVLSYLMRFKQICNHPSQWLSDGRYDPEASGKFARLKELCEEIAARQEKVLVFTQFREMTEPLSRYLAGIFGRPGIVLHGETAIKKRKELVDSFKLELGPPFFVLSLKAGGTGLNLTAASHVIHFDRWWNPAVENQATDRAYRIGQNKNVLVHKFVCRGTIEEKVDELIASKLMLSKQVLEGGQETLLTELPNDELLKLVSLDMRSAVGES